MAVDAECPGQFGGVKLSGQANAEHVPEIRGRFQPLDAAQIRQLLVGDLEVVITVSAAAAMSGVAILVRVNQRDVQRQVGMREYAGEVNELAKNIEQFSPLGTEPSADFPPILAGQLDQSLADDDRFHNDDLVLPEQLADFVPDGGQLPMLDFDQRAVTDGIDTIPAVPGDFGLGGRTRIDLFQLAVQRCFHGSTRRGEVAR